MSEGESGNIAYSVRRGGDGAFASLSGAWEKRWVRWAAYLLGLALLGMALIWVQTNCPRQRMLLVEGAELTII